MIEINRKEDCCGCEACLQVCPKRCISFAQDEEGFFYPKVTIENCIECGLCERVCPVVNQTPDVKESIAIYAAKNPDEKIRKESSSGGIFTMLAEKVINRGGVVFGARWNEKWEVVHDYSETVESLAAFRGSKYLQSRIGDSFALVKHFLKGGREVLFSGTPCQVSALRLFLSKEYENLLTVDFICHGVPSPKVWSLHLDEIVKKRKIGTIQSISFRDKTIGWDQYKFAIKGSNSNFSEFSRSNVYMRGFLRNIYLRPSCHRCPSNSFKSGSDILIADFWGLNMLHPDFDNNSGVNLVVINSLKGEVVFNDLGARYISSNKKAYRYNSSIYKSSNPHPKRSIFFETLAVDSKRAMPYVRAITKDPLILRIKVILYKLRKLFFKRT